MIFDLDLVQFYLNINSRSSGTTSSRMDIWLAMPIPTPSLRRLNNWPLPGHHPTLPNSTTICYPIKYERNMLYIQIIQFTWWWGNDKITNFGVYNAPLDNYITTKVLGYPKVNSMPSFLQMNTPKFHPMSYSLDRALDSHSRQCTNTQTFVLFCFVLFI